MKEENAFLVTSTKIRTLQKIIVSEWEQLVMKHLDEDKKESRMILRDHLPEILSDLALALERGSRNHLSMESARAHGFQRAVLTKFTIDDVLNEYSLLRETLVTYLYPIGDLECVKFVHWYIDSLSRISVEEFVNDLRIGSRLHMQDPGISPPLL